MNIVKSFWREITIIVLALLFFGSVRQCSVNNSDKDVLLHVNDSAFTVAHYYLNKNNELVGQIKTHELTIEQWKKYGNQLGFDNKDLKKQVGNSNRLVAHWRGKAEANGVIHIALRDTTINTMDESMDFDSETPTVNTKAFEWSNKYLSFNGIINPDSNQLSIKYQYATDFSLTAYHKSQGLFKKPQLVADIWFEDPNMKVQEFKGFVITPPKKRFFQTGVFKISIGLAAGYGISQLISK